MFHLRFVHYTFSSVLVAELGNRLGNRLAICSHCLLPICIFINFPFGFKRGIWLLIA